MKGRVEIVLEASSHSAGVRRLHLAAFPTIDEADLVDRLRADGDAELALVALADGVVAGHVVLSRMQAPFKALGLGPIAVDAGKRRAGIGGLLVRGAIARSADAGWDAIFVLGDPAYYERFGFSAKAAADFGSPYAGPYLMVIALGGRELPASSGDIAYAPAFAALG